MRIHTDPKPAAYPEVLALIERIGIEELLLCVMAFAGDKYDDAVTARYADNTRNPAGIGMGDFQNRETQLDRESYRWMSLRHIEYPLGEYKKWTRLAVMPDEDVRAEAQAARVKKAEEALEAAKAGKAYPGLSY